MTGQRAGESDVKAATKARLTVLFEVRGDRAGAGEDVVGDLEIVAVADEHGADRIGRAGPVLVNVILGDDHRLDDSQRDTAPADDLRRRTHRLVKATRNIVIPVVNPDGFNISREAPDAPAETELTDPFAYEMKRKNCWPDPDAMGTCESSSVGRLLGVDLNRNYGGFWGGSGASIDRLDDAFRGTGPFSEPETQNNRELQATRPITNLITNHTYSNLVLRPPGVVDAGAPLEETLL